MALIRNCSNQNLFFVIKAVQDGFNYTARIVLTRFSQFPKPLILLFFTLLFLNLHFLDEKAAAQLNCNDDNPCTEDELIVFGCPALCPSTGCPPCPTFSCSNTPLADGSACDNGDLCTTGDMCASGICESGSPVNCDNGLFCDGTETCNSASGACLSGIPPSDDDNVACTVDSCNESTDSFDHTPMDSLCADGMFCNGDETCDAVNGCQAGTSPIIDDGIACTIESCDEITDTVSVTPDNSVCDNGAFCDGDETCDAVIGCQAGTPPTDDDNVACTVDTCNEATDSFDHTPDNSLCDDSVGCTDDVCNGSACVITPNNANCDNGQFCDGSETCDGALDCQAGTPPDENDNVACTDDSCDEAADKIVNTPNDSLCDNGLFCDGSETCDGALDCQAGTPPDEDDSVGCTDDSCDEAADKIVNTPNDDNCDNDLFCDGEETCDAVNDCQAGTPPETDDQVACTDDSCDEDTDQVVNAANDENCDNDVFCDGEETCNAVNGCQEGTPVDPDDEIDCTEDSCDEDADLVVNAPDDSFCDDNVFCNGVEACDVDEGCIEANSRPDGAMCTADNAGPEGECINGGCVNEGVITILKIADPNDGTDFEFGCTDEDIFACGAMGDENGLFTVDDEPEQTDEVEQTFTSDLMFIGSYTIEELLPAGWQLDEIECINDEDGESVLDADANMVLVDLDPAEDITCTFFNSAVQQTGVLLTVETELDSMTTAPGDMVSIPVDISNPDAQTNSLTVTNQIAPGVVFSVEIPEGFDVEALSTTRGTCDIETLECAIGDIQPGETVTVIIDAVVSQGEGVFRVNFRVSTSQGQEFTGTATVNVQGSGDLGSSGGNGAGGGGCAVASNYAGQTELFGLLAPFVLLPLLIVLRRSKRK